MLKQRKLNESLDEDSSSSGQYSSQSFAGDEPPTLDETLYDIQVCNDTLVPPLLILITLSHLCNTHNTINSFANCFPSIWRHSKQQRT